MSLIDFMYNSDINKLPCHDSHKESYSVTDTKTNIIYSGSIKRINS